MLEINSLSLTLARRTVLRDISATVRRGRLTVLLGKNGSGKTSLLRCLTRELPYEGRVTLDGMPTEELAPRELARRLAYLPQLLPETPLTVRELAMLGRSPYLSLLSHPSEDDRAAVLSAMQRVGVEALAERSLLSLSGGERRRAFLAMVLAQATPLLLLDEPTSHLDAITRRELLALLGTATRGEGTCALVVLHDVNDAIRLADDILLMEEGRLTFAGTRDEFLAAQFPERHFGLTRVATDGTLPFFY